MIRPLRPSCRVPALLGLVLLGSPALVGTGAAQQPGGGTVAAVTVVKVEAFRG